MKKLCRCLLFVTGLWGCGQSVHNGAQGTSKTTAASLPGEEPGKDSRVMLSREDAEKILGEPARLSDSATSIVADTIIFQSSYSAIATDKKSGKTGNIYFMYEQYKDASTAHYFMKYYQTANEKNGAETVKGIGDEAWFHTDGQNFYFIMARKGNKMIRMKVNKLTATTLLDAFNAVAKQIVERM